MSMVPQGQNVFATMTIDESVLLVEQDTKRVLRVSDRVYVIKLGVPVFTGTPDEMHQQDWSQLF
jgi:ABC-type branched-subunit amino acid transport system ATPase component